MNKDTNQDGFTPSKISRSKRLTPRPNGRSGFSTGFTLVELLMALAVFSFVMLILTVGFIQITRLYQANLASRRTQQAARIVIDDISREVHAAQRIGNVSPDRLCLEGSKNVDYRRINAGVDKYVIRKTILVGSCAGPPSSDPPVDLIAAGGEVQATSFAPSIASGVNDQPISVRLTVTITTTGVADLLDPGEVVCQPGPGSQFCSTTTYSIAAGIRGQTQ